MKQKMFSVYDDKAKSYITPFFVPEKGQAVRMFTDTVNDPQTVMHKHPEDFVLFFVGVFDTEDGGIEAVVPHEVMVSAIQVKGVRDA